MFKRYPLITLSIAFIISSCFTACFAYTGEQQKAVDQFIQHMVDKDHFDAAKLKKLFFSVKLNEFVLNKKHARDHHPIPWYRFQSIFITPNNLKQGEQYQKEHTKTIQQISEKFDISPYIIIGIIGVETKFGQHEGQFRVIDTLSSFVFNPSARQPFFKYELEQFLLMCRQYHLNPLSVHGSYAGAMGKPQFMPHAVMQYAVHFNRSRPFSLDDDADAMASIANYLKQNGWQPHVQVAKRITQAQYQKSRLPEIGTLPFETSRDLKTLALNQPEHISKKPLFKFTIEGKDQTEYWLGYYNLYVLTRYNRNLRYGLVVDLLGKTIQQQINNN